MNPISLDLSARNLMSPMANLPIETPKSEKQQKVTYITQKNASPMPMTPKISMPKLILN